MDLIGLIDSEQEVYCCGSIVSLSVPSGTGFLLVRRVNLNLG